MTKCVVCEGTGRLLVEICPLCDGVPNWPDIEERVACSPHVGNLEIPPRFQVVVNQMRRHLPTLDRANQLSVISFNMLLKGFDKKPYYPSVPFEYRTWPRRREMLLEVIRGIDADVYCMQEVECLSFDQERAFLDEIGYASVAPKDDSKGKCPYLAKPAFFYKADRLEFLWADHRSRVVLASFRHRCSGRVVYMATCHLEGAPWEAAKRIAQTKKALDSIQRHQKQCGTGPGHSSLIFAGDFNEAAHGAVCHLLRRGLLEQSFRAPGLPDVQLTQADYSHGFCLSDLYGCADIRPATFCAPPEESAAWGSQVDFASVDFMFYSHGSLRPVAIREPFTLEQLEETRGGGIPSEWHFSDHVPIGGVFELIAQSNVSASVPTMMI